MKKKLAAAITTALVVGVASTTFAAANPFVDVPAKHWSYDAVAKLAQAGIVDGYGDATYRGDRTITRYEMAQIVAKAMTKSDQADAQQKAALDKLAVEYAAELNNLGVRVAKLEANQSNIKFTGEARFRYEHNDYKGGFSSTDDYGDKDTFKLRTRIHMTGAINDDWSYGGRFEASSNLRHSGDQDNEVKLNNAYVTGPLAGVQFTAGRFDYMPAYGAVIDSTLDGVKLEFGNTLKTTLFYGKDENDNVHGLKNIDVDYYGVELKYKASKATNLVAAYHHFDDITASASNSDFKIWEVGFDADVAKNVKLIGNYVDSNADSHDNAWLAGVQFKQANYKNKGSFDVFANYRNVEVNSVWDPTLDGSVLTNGSKGYELGFHYVPMKNALVQVKYIDVKDVDISSVKDKFFRAQVEFFF